MEKRLPTSANLHFFILSCCFCCYAEVAAKASVPSASIPSSISPLQPSPARPEIWKDVNATKSPLFYRYMRIYFAPVERWRPGDPSGISFFLQHPPLQRPPHTFSRLPPRLAAVTSKVDFGQATVVAADPFSQVESQIAELSVGEVADELRVNTGAMKVEMSQVLTHPRNAYTHPTRREEVGGYLYKKLARLGLLVAMQEFRHKMAISEFAMELDGELLKPIFEAGMNIIGILPGRYFATSRDRPLIVVAHWDVVHDTTGFNDNGSGLEALLESARVLSSAPCLKAGAKHSILFAAMDAEEAGSVGSLEFVREFLLPKLVRESRGGIGGVFVLDTIINADRRPGSQDVALGWSELVPGVVQRIEKRGRVGDFIAVMARNKDGDKRLMHTFKKYFNRDNFGVEEFELKKLSGDAFPSLDLLAEHAFFWQSDNSRFWFYREKDANYSFPTVMITDTAFFRGYMRNCYHRSCDELSHVDVDETDFDFLAETTQALVYALADLATEGQSKCKITPYKRKETHVEDPQGDASKETFAPLKTPESAGQSKPDFAGHMTVSQVEIAQDVGVATTAALAPSVTAGGEDANGESDFLRTSHQSKSNYPELEWFSARDSSSTSYNIGTQINIGTLSIELGKQLLRSEAEEGPTGTTDADNWDRPNLILGSGDVDTDVLAKIVQGYFKSVEGDKEVDRRKYKGKHKNSPMLIKLLKN